MPVPADRLRAFAGAVLQSAGVPAADAAIVAETLVEADLRGVHSHGVMLLSLYVKRLQAGLVRAQAEMATVAEGPAFAVVDAHNSLGQVAGVRAMDLGRSGKPARAVSASWESPTRPISARPRTTRCGPPPRT